MIEFRRVWRLWVMTWAPSVSVPSTLVAIYTPTTQHRFRLFLPMGPIRIDYAIPQQGDQFTRNPAASSSTWATSSSPSGFVTNLYLPLHPLGSIHIRRSSPSSCELSPHVVALALAVSYYLFHYLLIQLRSST